MLSLWAPYSPRIAAEPERMSRERCVALHEDPDDPDEYFERLGQEAFTKRFAGEVGDHIDPKIVQQDLAELKAAAGTVEKYTDRNIAHADREGTKAMATFGDIDKTIDVLGAIFRKYALLFTAASYVFLDRSRRRIGSPSFGSRGSAKPSDHAAFLTIS